MDAAAAALLLSGFRAHDPLSYTPFVTALVLALRATMKKRWSSLKHAHRDMAKLALVTVVE